MAKTADYLKDVRRYDTGASEAVVQKIVTHLGIALKSKDASLVACSDQKEKDRIVEGWLSKKLGLSGDTSQLVEDVCKMMKDDNQKQRVTFYYLLAMQLGRLGDI